jgi:hypothetical protein
LGYEGDEERDGEKEPLLDLSSEANFTPRMVPCTPSISLEAVGYTVGGWQYTDLDWTGTDPALSTIIYRDGEDVDTEGIGVVEYTDEAGERGAGMHFYWVCQTGLETVCSNVVVVIY